MLPNSTVMLPLEKKSSFTPSSTLGRVDSILSHVKPNWWTSGFQETYLRTNGDVVEDPSITASECRIILSHPLVRELIGSKEKGGKGAVHAAEETAGVSDSSKHDATSLRLLDLCCGQGRHTLYLARQLPAAEFHGHDQSVFLVDLARERACAAGVENNVMFTIGRADQVPAASGSFDIVLLMGNSLGYGDGTDDVGILQEVHRVLKPGGVFLLDLPDADEMVNSVKARGWEWVDGRDTAALLANDSSVVSPANGAQDRKLLACRERELSAGKDRLATRELVIDIEQGVVEDSFYSIKNYGVVEMTGLLERCGLAISAGNPNNNSSSGGSGISTSQAQHQRIPRPASRRNEELGMMEYRNMIVSQRPDFTGQGLPSIAGGGHLDFYAHPSLSICPQPHKGNSTCATAHIRAGTLLIVDTPYACVPSVHPVKGEWVPCSRPECNRRIPRGNMAGNATERESGETMESPRCHCHDEVAWCDDNCRVLDERRHSLECEWLAANADEIVKRHGTYDFNMLWLVARILARRWLELTTFTPEGKPGEDTARSSIESRAPFGDNTWATVEHTILSNREKFGSQRVEHWRTLASTYLTSQPFSSSAAVSDSRAQLDVPSLVELICKEETNSFGLYPKRTGMFPVPASDGESGNDHTGGEARPGRPGRGTAYAIGFYTGATLINHSCSPNVSCDSFLLSWTTYVALLVHKFIIPS